jgi:hypothetical protein
MGFKPDEMTGEIKRALDMLKGLGMYERPGNFDKHVFLVTSDASGDVKARAASLELGFYGTVEVGSGMDAAVPSLACDAVANFLFKLAFHAQSRRKTGSSTRASALALEIAALEEGLPADGWTGDMPVYPCPDDLFGTGDTRIRIS